MRFDEKKEYLTPGEVAQLLRTSRQTVYSYISAGKLKGIKVGRRRLFPIEEIEAFLGSDISKKVRKKVRTVTPELEKARNGLERADGLRRRGVGKELLELMNQIKPVIQRDGSNNDLAQLHFTEASGYMNIGRFAKAAALLKTASENVSIAENELLEGRIMGTYARVEQARKNYNKAIAYYDEALKIFRKINEKGSIAITYQNLGVLLSGLKRSYDAIAYYNQALEIAKSTKMPRQFEPNILISLSDSYLTVGDNSQALNIAEKAWNIGSRRKDLALKVRASSLIAKSLYNLQDIKGASEFFRISLDGWRQLPEDWRNRLISTAINSCIGLADFKACLEYLRYKDKLQAKLADPSGDIPWHLLNYAKCYLGLKKPDKALTCANNALDQQIQLGQLDRLRSFNGMKAKCLLDMGKYTEACTEFDEALFHLEAEIERALTGEARANLGYYLAEMTDHLTDAIFKLTDDEEALHFALNLIARDLRLVITANAIYPDPIPGRFTARKLVRNTGAIADFFGSFTSVVPGQLSKSQREYQSDRLAKLRKSRKDLTAKLVKENPSYLPLQGESAPGIDEIKKLFNRGSIPPESSLLFLTLGPSSGQGFLVNRKGVVLRKQLPIDRDRAMDHTATILANCRTIGVLADAGLTPSMAEKYNLNGLLNNLYLALLKPFTGNFDNDRPLIVLTDHSLINLPFHALFDGERYLCEYLRIFRVLSPAFLRVLRKHEKPHKKPKSLIVSPWADDRTESIFAHIRAIPNRRIRLSTGSDTSADKIRPAIGKYDSFLYLGEEATHSVNPQRASLLLGEGPGIVANDFFTQRYDLSGVKSILLHTGGVTRQADTKHDFFMPIQRGFLTAGANTVGSFLWKMDDASLGRVLNELYNGFTDNGTVGYEAIRQAQIRMIRDTMTSHPYFWAGIQCYNLTIEY